MTVLDQWKVKTIHVYKVKRIQFPTRHKNRAKEGYVCEYICPPQGPLDVSMRFIKIAFICTFFCQLEHVMSSTVHLTVGVSSEYKCLMHLKCLY